MTIKMNAELASSQGSFQLEDEFMIPMNVDLATWLMQVEYYSDLGTPEGDKILIQLAENSPNLANASPDTKLILAKVKDLGVTKRWDPTLSPNSKAALNGMRIQLKNSSEKMDVERPKPTCSKKLNFDNVLEEKTGFGFL